MLNLLIDVSYSKRPQIFEGCIQEDMRQNCDLRRQKPIWSVWRHSWFYKRSTAGLLKQAKQAKRYRTINDQIRKSESVLFHKKWFEGVEKKTQA